MEILPERWGTQRLIVRDAVMEDVPHLQNVFDACAYVGDWDNTFYEETEEAFTQLVSKSLKLNPSAEEVFKMQSVLLRGGENIIGYFHLFHEAPIPHHVWISMFVVQPYF